MSRDLTENENESQISELKYATTVDILIASGDLKAPHHIKIDVDGNEILILEGMSHLLSGPHRPRTIQVEMNDPHKIRILEFMKNHQYHMSHKHYTRSASLKIEAGNDPETLSYNAIFLHDG